MIEYVRSLVINLVAFVAQHLILAPLIPPYVLHLLGEWGLEFATWMVKDRAWAEWIFKMEAAVNDWRDRSLGSSKP